MLKNRYKKNAKRVVEYIFMVILYIIIWTILLLKCLVHKVKKLFKLRKIFKLYAVRNIFHNLFNKHIFKNIFKWNDLFLKYLNLFKEEKDNNIEINKKLNKIPKHIYIVLKINDVIMLNKKKLLNYFLNIIIYLYELRVKYLTIYISDYFFNSLFYDDLTQYLFEHNFFMKPLIHKYNNNNNFSTYNLSDEFIITKFINPIKKLSFQNLFHKKKENCSKTYNTYDENFSLYLKFVNKESSHKKIIEIAKESSILSNGEMVNDDLIFYNKNIESTIRKIYNKDEQNFYKNEICLLQISDFFEFLKKLRKGAIFKMQYFLNILNEKIIEIFHFVKKVKYFHSKTNIGEKFEKTRDHLSIIKSDNISSKENDENSILNIVHQLFDNSIYQDNETIGIIKKLIHTNIPLYVKPLNQDIFMNNSNHFFNNTPVDVVISLRMGLFDYLLSTAINYKSKKNFHKKNFFNFLLEYLSSFFFLFNIVHPFEKNGIQPWVLSESELYEFFSYNIKSIKKAINYYSCSTQRYGY
ncbi:conserved Plasmodium protein, unknown function [Plasmodium gallinaceum]|uniref:Uncharacterized protein n=1 Tax=Plasmodium gallinaceum TaxID=5849 RepID=A0A1J1GME4_PLAGA|nr:conserved Plasmodium protein, unknown function [Plasmodium gallinaceum]CRG93421.1 conserved Plasmodium protein, unknown function [Plasmodium gallinaceum]